MNRVHNKTRSLGELLLPFQNPIRANSSNSSISDEALSTTLLPQAHTLVLDGAGGALARQDAEGATSA